MSIYLYGFKTQRHNTPTTGGGEIGIHELTFRMGSWGRTEEDEKRGDRISRAIDRAWGDRDLPQFFTVGKREDGAEIHEVQRPLCHAEWIDTSDLPGDAQRVGVLRKIKGRYVAELFVDMVEEDTQFGDGVWS